MKLPYTVIRQDVYSVRSMRLMARNATTNLPPAHNGPSLQCLQSAPNRRIISPGCAKRSRWGGRVLGENHEITLRMSRIRAGCALPGRPATLRDLREAVTSLEDTERIPAPRVPRKPLPARTLQKIELRSGSRARKASAPAPSGATAHAARGTSHPLTEEAVGGPFSYGVAARTVYADPLRPTRSGAARL